ncbi:hypothetical protein [Streptomyces xanthophaeus]|uniref:Uncharacterized protein n=1 Tax=Streptomyces xanthophaeus TaxID=67385 RepID=A0A919GYM9_9ACTN|nr:hypothetical protein [Streptomyces xanthophaeus]GHI84114.1 hypothetical protein Sxan_14780 [Streptomyces xanthophaeus]
MTVGTAVKNTAQRSAPWTNRTGNHGDHLDVRFHARREVHDETRSPFAAERAAVVRHLVKLVESGKVGALRPAADAGEWRHAVEAHPALGTVRSDFHAVLVAVSKALAVVSHQEAATVRQRHVLLAEKAAELAGRAISTRQVARSIKRLAEHGLIVVLVAGRVGNPATGASPVVPLYALTVPQVVEDVIPDRTPNGRGRTAADRTADREHRIRKALGLPVDESGHLERPAVSSDASERSEDRRASVLVDGSGHRNLGNTQVGGDSPLPPARRPPRSGRRSSTRPGSGAPRPRRGEITQTQKNHHHTRLLRDGIGHHVVLHRITPGRLARLLEPFALAGWSPSDIRHAMEHGPDGGQHIQTDRVRKSWSWLRYRLSFWIDQAGAPLPSKSQTVRPGWHWTGYTANSSATPSSRPWTVRFEEPLEPGPTWSDPVAAAHDTTRTAAEFNQIMAAQERADAEAARQMQRAAWDAATHIAEAAERRRLADEQAALSRYTDLDSPILRYRRETASASRRAALLRKRAEETTAAPVGPRETRPSVQDFTAEMAVYDPAPLIFDAPTEAERLVDLDPNGWNS